MTADPRPLVRMGSSTAALASHYDVGDEFFRLWLSSDLGYSAAKWDADVRDLDSAERRKLDYWADHLTVPGDGLVVDVGCGWGAASRRLADRGATVIALTLNASHADYVRRTLGGRVDVHRTPWQEYRAPAPLDAVLCIEALEHFASDMIDDAGRAAVYAGFFDWILRQGTPRVRVGLQVIVFGNVGRERRTTEVRESVPRQLGETFPETTLPTLAELAVAWDPAFECIRMENATSDYVRTIRAWATNLRRERDRAESVTSSATTRAFQRYLAAAETVFRLGDWTLLRVTLQRRRRVR